MSSTNMADGDTKSPLSDSTRIPGTAQLKLKDDSETKATSVEDYAMFTDTAASVKNFENPEHRITELQIRTAEAVKHAEKLEADFVKQFLTKDIKVVKTLQQYVVHLRTNHTCNIVQLEEKINGILVILQEFVGRSKVIDDEKIETAAFGSLPRAARSTANTNAYKVLYEVMTVLKEMEMKFRELNR